MYVYRIAFDPSFGRLSPGVINTLDAIENAAAEARPGRVPRRRRAVQGRARGPPRAALPGPRSRLHAEGKGGRGSQGRRDPHADAAQTVADAPPLLLRGPRAGPPDAGEAHVKYVAKALVTRARSTAWAARTNGQDEGDGLRILFYHRVSDDRDELAVSPRDFRRQMDYLATESYRSSTSSRPRSCSTRDLVPPDGRTQLRRRVRRRGRAGATASGRAWLSGDRLRRAGGRRRVGDVRVVPLAAARVWLGRDRRSRPRGDAPLRGPLAHAPESPLAARDAAAWEEISGSS